MLALDPARSGLENGRIFGALDTGRFRIIKGEDMEGSGGTGLASR
jgi:hypothetical protein